MLWNNLSYRNILYIYFSKVYSFIIIIRSDSQAELQPGVKKAKLTEKEKDEREDSPKIVIYSSDEETSIDMKNKTLRRQKRKRVLEFSGKSHYKIVLVAYSGNSCLV